MAANYVLIEKISVGAAGASSVTFSSIPQTGYTDLVVKVCARMTTAAAGEYLNLSFNGVTTNLQSKNLYGYSTAAASYNEASIMNIGQMPGSTATANTFGSADIYIPNYTSSNYKSVSLDVVAENNSGAAASATQYVEAGLWSSTAAITSITMTAQANLIAANSTFYLYGVAKLGTTPAIVPYATGGDTIMTDGTYWYHTFTSSGTFTPQKSLSCDYLVVAGGGGSASGSGGGYGGGGAGGLRSTVTATGGGGSLESKLSLGTSAYTVTIGAGGGVATNGSDSTFATITATGGGKGAGTTASGNGGSGGGGSDGQTTAGTGTTNQGYAGGAGTGSGGGGGGGAASAGLNGSTNDNAGAGLQVSITGSSVYYAAGGGGGGSNNAAAKNGIGGKAENPLGSGNNTAGVANTGSGGGGGWNSGAITGKAGGSGIVIVRYAV